MLSISAHPLRRLAHLPLILAFAAAGCFPDVTVDDPTVQLSCDDDDDCPADFACKRDGAVGRCIASSVLAKVPLTLAQPLTIEGPASVFSANDGHNIVVVVFAFTEAPARTSVTLSGDAFDCADADVDFGFRCSLAVSAAETPAGRGAVRLLAADAAENIVDESVDVVIDFAAPAVVRTGVSISAPGGIIDDPVAATVGSVVVVDAFFDEALVDAPAAVTLLPAGEVCGDVRLNEAKTALSCSAVIVGTDEGRSLSFSAEDEVGNAGAVTVGLDLAFDFAAPAAPATAVPGAVVYQRAPWGSGDDASPTFSLAATAAAVAAGERVAVFADSDGVFLLGVGEADGVAFDLGGIDHPVVFVAAVDEAGLRSATLAVEEQRYTVTYGGKVGTRVFENPHQVFAVASLGDALTDEERELADPEPLHPGVAGGVVANTRAAWVERLPSLEPPGRSQACLAFDEARDEVVLFGGAAGVTLGDTWIFHDNTWRQEFPPSSPPGLARVACAWDPVRDVVVVVGGVSDLGQNEDVWEWDGGTWSLSASLGALLGGDVSRLGDVGAAFDSDRGAVVVVGASATQTLIIGDTITSLTQTSPVGADPIVLAVDAGVLWVSGSDAQILTASWQPAAPLPAAVDDGVGFVDEDGVAVVIAPDALEDSDPRFRLDAGGWTVLPALAVDDRRGGMAAARYDDALVFGGLDVDGPGSIVVAGAAASPLLPPPASPALAAITQATFDPGDADEPAGLVALAGDELLRITPQGAEPLGSARDGLLVADGAGVARATLVADGGLVFDFAPDGAGELLAQRIVDNGVWAGASVDGGRAVRLGDDIVVVLTTGQVLRLRGTVWGTEPVAPLPEVGFGLAVVDDGNDGSDVVVLFPDRVGHTWLYDGQWTDLGAIGPSRRSNVAMAADLADSSVLLFGGIIGATFSDEAWRFRREGAAGSWTQLDEPGPSARAGGAAAWDPVARDVVVVGGLFSNDEIWQWHSGAKDTAALRFSLALDAAQVDDASIVDMSVAIDGVAADRVFVWQAGGFVGVDDASLDFSRIRTGAAGAVHIVATAGDSDTAVTALAFEATFSFRSAP